MVIRWLRKRCGGSVSHMHIACPARPSAKLCQVQRVGDASDRRSPSTSWRDDGNRSELYNRPTGGRVDSVRRPAVTNAATSILVARDNCWPVIVLGGRRPLSMQGMGSFQELDAVPIYKSITKWSALVDSTSGIPAYLNVHSRSPLADVRGPSILTCLRMYLSGLASPSDLSFPELDESFRPECSTRSGRQRISC